MPTNFLRPSGLGEPQTRRGFLTAVSMGLGGGIALLVAVPVVAELITPIVEHPPSEWEDLGPVTDFPVGETHIASFTDPSAEQWAGQTATTAVWVRQQTPGQFVVFSVNCTHLGCPVNWLPGANLFECPCHGGVYYQDGTVAAGPPPRPLTRHPVRVLNGVVQAQSFPLPTT